MSEADVQNLVLRYREGATGRELAEHFKIGMTSVKRLLRETWRTPGGHSGLIVARLKGQDKLRGQLWEASAGYQQRVYGALWTGSGVQSSCKISSARSITWESPSKQNRAGRDIWVNIDLIDNKLRALEPAGQIIMEAVDPALRRYISPDEAEAGRWHGSVGGLSRKPPLKRWVC